MNIHGFTRTTLLDFPGHVACTVFTAGCNFRCPFCHNGDLVLCPDIYPVIDDSEIFAHLEKRHKVLSGVCISGGEPTLQSDLLEFIRHIKEYDLPVKLDTNGYRPDVLEAALTQNLLDYVAMDIKSSPDSYEKATGIQVDIRKIEHSVELLKKSGIPYEFRTTCVNGIHTSEDFVKIAKWLLGDCSYFLQSFKENDSVPDKNCSSFSKNELLEFIDILKPSIPAVTLRGVD